MHNPSSLPGDAERFLKEVRRGLGALDAAERDDVVEELRSHMLERLAQGKPDVLDGFEEPATLAASFVSERALRGALASGTPWSVSRALLISARDSIAVLFALVALVLVQLVAFFLILTAALKPFAPKDFGLWTGNGNFYVGRGTPSATEVLGWWGIPVLLSVGVLLIWLSNRGLRALARWRLSTRRPIGS